MTRRRLLEGAGALALLAAISGVPTLSVLRPAAAQTVSSSELMAPGPLPEQVLGKADAPVTIIEYASMTCGHCAQFHKTTYPELKKRYIDTGKVRFIFREFPLDPLAAAGFMLARCAGDGKYFPMIETLFSQQRQWAVQKPLPPLLAIAKQAGFTEEQFNKCLADQALLDKVEKVRERATKLGVTSTPTFFVNGKKISGSVSIDEFAKEIEPLIKS